LFDISKCFVRGISITLSNLNNIHDIFSMDSSFVVIKNEGKLTNKVKRVFQLDIIVFGGTTIL
jgi:hypothetical protein